MILKLSQIAEKIGARLEGRDIDIADLSTLDDPRPGTLSFVASRKYQKKIADCPCAALIVPPGLTSSRHSLLVMDDPYLGFALAMRLFYPDHRRPPSGIQAGTRIDATAEIGTDVYIGPNSVVGMKSRIGKRSVIHAGVYIGDNAVIGEDCFIYPNVVIMHNVVIGNRVAIYAGAVIGSDGFGYARRGSGFVKIPQAGTVVIEDDVEIGACTTIDRATIGETRIGTGCIIDNLVQIAHNCRVGAGSIICAQAGLAGTSILGRGVTLAGQVGIAGHLTIGDGALVEAQSGVHKDIPPGSKVFGYPARELLSAHRIEAIISNLPDYIQRIRDLERKVAELESKIPQEPFD